ncbi:DNA repair ATPase [Cytophagaceae bacterium ABcell3]|nr:DNA repair ATPase [Cytophagaceae bacterium ABcell3]
MAEDKNPSAEAEKNNNNIDAGAYRILRNRLDTAANDLKSRLGKLNEERKSVFGSVESRIIGNERVTTENNCVARDMISVGHHLLFGYNVHLGLKSEMEVSDVFNVYEFNDNSFHDAGLELINDSTFESDFRDLYKYYKNTVFEKFAVIGPFLYMVFRVGKNKGDIKTFKWLIAENAFQYQGNRSDHEFKFPPQFEFEWVRTTRDSHRSGKHPHVSVLDKVFIETVGGDLTIKVEDNTDNGEGILSEPVEDRDQKLDDAEIYYADLDNIILLKIKPFREKEFRYIVYNHRIKQAKRIDAIKDSCVLLPDNHGIIFSKGYYLQTGEYKLFENEVQGLLFEKMIASPNGEDFMYVFYSMDYGAYIMLPYNLINQHVENLIVCHGYSFFPDGELIYFTDQSNATKHHTIQIWQTPFVSPDYVPPVQSDCYLFKIGNKDIVRAMAECTELLNLLQKDDESYANLYYDIVKLAGDITDSYFWIREEAAFNLAAALTVVRNTASSAIDEFQKVQRIKQNTRQQTEKYAVEVKEVLRVISRERFEDIDAFVGVLSKIRGLRGEVISLKDLRYADTKFIEGLEKELEKEAEKVSERCVRFLLDESSLTPYHTKLEEQKEGIEKATRVAEVSERIEELNDISAGLEMLIDTVSNLKIEDATETTRIIDNISLIFSDLNQLKSRAGNIRSGFRKGESTAEFHAQIRLVEQAIVNYLDLCDTPEKCEEYLTRLMVQLEELEAKFSDFDEFITNITEKREEVYEAFENRKLNIVEARNNRANTLMSSADRILKGIQNRVARFEDTKDINGYFASDMMIDKVRDIIKELQQLNDSVKADELQGKLKNLREEALRQLRDKQDIFVAGANLVKFGDHHFSVNTQALDLTIVNRNQELFYHLTGTGFFEKVEDERLAGTREVWEQTVVSENQQVYRGEYLAYKIYTDAVAGRGESKDHLYMLTIPDLQAYVQQYMAPRYAEAYVKGVHDKDAALLLKSLLELDHNSDLLRYDPLTRACGYFCWNYAFGVERRAILDKRLKGTGIILKVFPDPGSFSEVRADLEAEVKAVLAKNELFAEVSCAQVAAYLFDELVRSNTFILSHEAEVLYKNFTQYLEKSRTKELLESSLEMLKDNCEEQFILARNWLHAFIKNKEGQEQLKEFADEATLLLLNKDEQWNIVKASLQVTLEGFSGNHAVVEDGKYHLHYNKFLNKMRHYESHTVPLFERYIKAKNKAVDEKKASLRLQEFLPKVMSSFVRNRLIDEVYLPLIGANFAKQLGAAGDNKRTDNSGMLLLVSPPGYGKTTLMEYIASRLGIIFMKINGPALGNRVTSLDPVEAPNAGAREEIEKLNLAFEMGDNVMIYVDDIQHCSAEFLQKFISLCDAQRRIEGVYKGRSKTYDFRGKKVCVVMAGNPYTETGEKFRIPDMLANRADTYNLGDIIGDKAEAFRLSYIENSMTSNTTLNKLSNRSAKDIYTFMQLAENGDRDDLSFEGNYSPEEISEIVSVLKKLFAVREAVLKVNLQYIYSASQSDDYREEPAFKMQGSYRNMNKMAEQVVPVMNDEELVTLIRTHYNNESQTLTTDAEANLLKFKAINNWLTEEEEARWNVIKQTFQKNQKFRGAGDNQVGLLVSQLSVLGDGVDGIRKAIEYRGKGE